LTIFYLLSCQGVKLLLFNVYDAKVSILFETAKCFWHFLLFLPNVLYFIKDFS
jgi:hypothetical protein